MGFQEAVKSVYSNYCKFDGRATRSEYWYFVLFSFLVSVVLVLGLLAGSVNSNLPLTILFGLLCVAFSLGSLVPSIAVCVRRLHDGGYSGWLYLLNFIPYIGGLIVFILVLQPSKPANQYGPNPFETADYVEE